MMSRMRTPAVACLAAAALGLAACGDSGGDEPDGLTRARVHRQDRRAVQGVQRPHEDAQRGGEPGRGHRARSEAQLLRELAPILERGYGQVRDNAAAFQAVNPPAADAAEIERIRKLYDEQAEVVRKLATAAKRGDIEQFKAAVGGAEGRGRARSRRRERLRLQGVRQHEERRGLKGALAGPRAPRRPGRSAR